MVDQSANARATNLPAELQSSKRMTALEARLGATLPHLATEANTQAVTVRMLSAAPGSLMAALPAGAAFQGGRSRMPTCPGARTSLKPNSPHRRSWWRSSGSTPLRTSLRLPCARAAAQGRSPRGTDAIPVRALHPSGRSPCSLSRGGNVLAGERPVFSQQGSFHCVQRPGRPSTTPRERFVARCGRAAVFSR